MKANCLVVPMPKYTRSNANFRSICDANLPTPYTAALASTWYNSIDVAPVPPEHHIKSLYLINKCAAKAGIDLTGLAVHAEIIRCYNAFMHKDYEFRNCLFLNVVLHTGDVPHVFHVSGSRDNTTRLSLIKGCSFLFDPMRWHSATAVSQTTTELVLLQAVIRYSSAKAKAAAIKDYFK